MEALQERGDADASGHPRPTPFIESPPVAGRAAVACRAAGNSLGAGVALPCACCGRCRAARGPPEGVPRVGGSPRCIRGGRGRGRGDSRKVRRERRASRPAGASLHGVPGPSVCDDLPGHAGGGAAGGHRTAHRGGCARAHATIDGAGPSPCRRAARSAWACGIAFASSHGAVRTGHAAPKDQLKPITVPRRTRGRRAS